jgi:hypothetical protein
MVTTLGALALRNTELPRLNMLLKLDNAGKPSAPSEAGKAQLGVDPKYSDNDRSSSSVTDAEMEGS